MIRRIFPVALLLASMVLPVRAAELKIVSLSPALTELIWQLGRGERMVGRSASCDYPTAVTALPVVGAFGVPSLERLAASGAGLVVADVFQDAGIRQSIERLGMRVLLLPLRSFADYRQAVTVLGRELDAGAAADRELNRLAAVTARFRARHPADAPKVPVLFVVWHDPLTVPGRDSFLTELLDLAGGVNLGAAEPRDYFRASPEWVIGRAPAVIIYPGKTRFAMPDYWKSLPAVRTGRFFRPAEESWFFRLSPRFDRALAALEQCLAAGANRPAGTE